MMRQPMYFVREYYPRGVEDDQKIIPLLFTHYSQHGVDNERAKRHFQLIKNDRYAFLYDTMNAEHTGKLKMAATQPGGFKIYVNVLPKVWAAPDHLKNQIYRYMLASFPEWEKDRNKKLKINIQDLFGKLYLLFTWKGNKIEVLLDEIEKY